MGAFFGDFWTRKRSSRVRLSAELYLIVCPLKASGMYLRAWTSIGRPRVL